MSNRLHQAITKKITIKLKSGLHIGGSKESLKIGGIDSSVVKHPLTDEPYIPGSSIKGKMRALLEMIEHPLILEKEKDGKMGAIQNPGNIIAKAFGCASKDVKIASRVIFEDLYLSNNDIVEGKNMSSKEVFDDMRSDFFEDKTENNVPRFLSGSVTPRHIERVPAGVSFEGQIVLLPTDGEYGVNEHEIMEVLEKGIKYINQTYLGGGGTRGNGRVEITLSE